MFQKEGRWYSGVDVSTTVCSKTSFLKVFLTHKSKGGNYIAEEENSFSVTLKPS